MRYLLTNIYNIIQSLNINITKIYKYIILKKDKKLGWSKISIIKILQILINYLINENIKINDLNKYEILVGFIIFLKKYKI